MNHSAAIPQPPAPPARAPSLVGEQPWLIGPLMRSVFSRFDEQGIGWAALRGAEGLPDYTRRDIDILVEPRRMSEARAIVRDAAKEHGWVRLVEFADPPQFSFSLMLPGPSAHFLLIELFTAQHHHGLVATDTDAGLKRRLRLNQWVWVVCPGFAAASTVVKEVLPYARLKESARDYVQQGALREPEMFLEAIDKTVGGGDVAHKLLNICQRGQWDRLQELAPKLSRAIWRRMPTRHLLQWLDYRRRILCYRLRPRIGVFAVIVGPQGSEKSSVAQHVLTQVQHRPFGTTRLLSSDADLLLGRVKLRRWRFSCFTSDRYFDHCHRKKTGFMRRWFTRLLAPRPDLIVYLDRDAADIHSQNPELAVEEIRRQQIALRAALNGRADVRIVDASGGIEETVRRVRDEIYQCLLRKLG